MLPFNEKLKLIIMSATFDSERFAHYFSQEAINEAHAKLVNKVHLEEVKEM